MEDIKAQAARVIGPLTGAATTWAVDLALRKGILTLRRGARYRFQYHQEARTR